MALTIVLYFLAIGVMKIRFINLLILSCLQDQGRVLYFAVKQLHYFNLQGISVDIAITLATAVAIGKVYLAIAYAILDVTVAATNYCLTACHGRMNIAITVAIAEFYDSTIYQSHFVIAIAVALRQRSWPSSSSSLLLLSTIKIVFASVAVAVAVAVESES